MDDRPSPLARAWLSLFALVGALLPRSSRETLVEPAKADLERALGEARGAGETCRLGVGAGLDALRHVPAEWWRTWRRDLDSNRDVRTAMGDGARDWARAARALRRRPGFAVVAALTLSLGIGVTLAIFAVVNAVLIRPLPFEDSEHIVWIRHHAPGLGLHELQSSQGMVNFYRETAGDVLETMAVLTGSTANLTGTDRPDRVHLVEASPDLFDVFRMTPLLGRRLLPEDVEGQAARVVVLTAGTWRDRFGSDPSVVGRTLQLDGVPYEIVGVLPESFETVRPDAFGIRPYRVDPDGSWGSFGIGLVARYPASVEFETAQARIGELQGRLPDARSDVTRDLLDGAAWSVTFEPLRERMIGDVSSALWLLMGTVGVVLLIACANVANLLLVRAEERQHEFAVHAALGAGRRRIARLLLRESVLLGLAGGALGIGVAALSVLALKSADPGAIPRLGEIRVDGAVGGVALLLSVGTGLLFGSVAVGRVSRTAHSVALRDGGMNATATRERRGARTALVAGQIALALVLLVGAALMLRSMSRIMAVDPGFDAESVVTMELALDPGTDPVVAEAFYREAVEQLAAIPGVAAAGGTNSLPLGGDYYVGSVEAERFPRADDDLPKVTARKAIAGDYLGTMGVELLRGRPPSDFAADAPVAWVSRAFLEEFLPGVEQPLGERVRLDDAEDWLAIVGVVEDTREQQLVDEPTSLVLLPFLTYSTQTGSSLRGLVLTARTGLDAGTLAPAVRAAIARLDEDVPVTSVRSMDEILRENVATTTFTLWLLGLAAAMALVLGTVGLYGVVSYVVGRRTRELGLRMALGAERSSVQLMVVRQSFTVVAVGTGVGLVGAYALSRAMSSLLFGITARDPVAFGLAPVLLIVVGLLASWLPARRASRVDPVAALRAD